jgi:hypothetical protein
MRKWAFALHYAGVTIGSFTFEVIGGTLSLSFEMFIEVIVVPNI